MGKVIALATVLFSIVAALVAGEIKLSQATSELRRARFAEGNQAV